MRTAVAPDLCEPAPLRSGHTLLSCELDAEKHASNLGECERDLEGNVTLTTSCIVPIHHSCSFWNMIGSLALSATSTTKYRSSEEELYPKVCWETSTTASVHYFSPPQCSLFFFLLPSGHYYVVT